MCSDKSESFGSKEWKVVRSILARHRSLFGQLGSLTTIVASITTKSTRVSLTIYTCLQGTRKIGCQAHITRYPDFTLSEVDSAISLQKQRERKKY